jgi:hypothetical protein
MKSIALYGHTMQRRGTYYQNEAIQTALPNFLNLCENRTSYTDVKALLEVYPVYTGTPRKLAPLQILQEHTKNVAT